MPRALPLAALLAALAGCAQLPPASSPMPDGGPSPAPYGWQGYCERHAGDPSCPRS